MHPRCAFSAGRRAVFDAARRFAAACPPAVAAALVCAAAVATGTEAQEPRSPESTAAAGGGGRPPDGEAPTEESLGFPIYPSARFLTSYDAGRGQRYYLFGVSSSFTDMVNYYRLLLDERGDRVFDAPATHVFEVGRFREETMAFPPGVTVKDYTWNGSEGYLHAAGAEPERFPTILQIVPAPPAAPER